MRKLLLYIALTVTVVTGLQSCSNEVDDLFPESAAQRLNNSVEKYHQLLQSADSGWVMEYFPGYPTEIGGYVYTSKFYGEDVDIRSQLTFTNGTGLWLAGSASTLQYDVKAEQGVILSFDTFSYPFHFWSRPTTSNYAGYQGDYEFEFMRTSQDEDTITLRGKKYGNTMTMFKLKEGAREYINEVADMTDATLMPDRRYFTINGTQYPFLITANGILYIISQDSTQIDAQGRTIFRPNGFGFYEPLEYNGTTMKDFTYDTTTGDLVSENGSAVIKMPSLKEQFYSPRYDWAFQANTNSRKYNCEMLDSMFATFKYDYDRLGNAVARREWAIISNTNYGGYLASGQWGLFISYYPYSNYNQLSVVALDVALSDDNSTLTIKDINRGHSGDTRGELLNNYLRFAEALDAYSPYSVEFNQGPYKHTVKFTSKASPGFWFTLVLDSSVTH